MASVKRVFVEGGVYHVYNRGNHRAQIFLHPEDSIYFLIRLHKFAKREGVDVLAYCLMSNHFHLLVRQAKSGSLIKVMRSLSVSYAKYHNWQYEQVGHLFQGRYGSRFIYDNADLANVARYIHRNPASIGDISSYRWSDLNRHLVGRTLLLDLLGWEGADYRRFVYEKAFSEQMQPTSKVITG